jgi:hypothetical protein
MKVHMNAPLYVALLALLNLGLGYALALYMERGRRTGALAATEDLDADL